MSALANVHTTGQFGDYKDKNENNLLKIFEIKDLLIVQIVQYKNSTVSIESSEIDGLRLKDGKNMIGEKLFVMCPLKDKVIPVEIVSSHYVDPKGERVRSWV